MREERGSPYESRQQRGDAHESRQEKKRRKPTVQDVFNQDEDGDDAPKKRKLGKGELRVVYWSWYEYGGIFLYISHFEKLIPNLFLKMSHEVTKLMFYLKMSDNVTWFEICQEVIEHNFAPV